MKNKTKLVNLKSYKNSMKYIFMIHDLMRSNERFNSFGLFINIFLKFANIN